MGDFFTWWMERPWWLRWLITLLPLGVALVLLVAAERFYYWIWGVGVAMFFINLFVSWGEILDKLMPRKRGGE
jgi:hypothetical protein